MALFDKLFSLKRRLDSDHYNAKDRSRSCQISPEQVRLLLFKECDWRGRRLLFDSSAIQKVPAGKHDKPSVRQDELPCIVEVANGFSYMYKGPEEDAAVLGEMIFGAVAMNYKSVSLKIHIMDEPRRLMCTKVFRVPTSRRISRAERKTSDRTDASASSSSIRASNLLRNPSKPLNVPAVTEDGVALSFSMDRGDSGFCGDQSSYSSVGSTYDYFSMFDAWDGVSSQDDFYSFHSLPGRKLSTSSNGSWQRRTFQNIATRFDMGQSSHLLNVPTEATSSDSQLYSNSSTSATNESIASGSSLALRKSKLGLAVLITVADAVQLDLVRKCMEHSPQLQALVCRLRLATLTAGASSSFVSTLHRASEDAALWLSDLIYGPRLQPAWLAMVRSDVTRCNKLADVLLADFCSVLAVGDTKTTNFFISTLLTHVLTYHLGWVTTVSPYDTVEHQPPPTDPRRPYNALWAQLSDLCGSIGYPPRAARTIISGEKNTQFINRLLSILTYFLRCGDVKRTEFSYKKCAVKEIKTISVNQAKSVSQMNSVNTQNSDISVSTLTASDVSLKKTATLADLRYQQLSRSPECGSSSTGPKPSCALKRNPTVMLSSLKASSDSSLNSTASNDSVQEQKVVFVLGDDEKLVGLKNKSTNGKSVKRSSKVQNEYREERTKEGCEVRNTESPSKCCGQTLQHSKPIKHSGFKFEFDKYPQIVTNYMKSKNLEILDRHYIGKPGNLKLDNFQFDPMIVPPIQEDKCDACEKCQLMESMLQTPTNASEMEYMNDMPRISEPQYAKETVVTEENRNHRELSPKTFVRRRKQNVVVVNLNRSLSASNIAADTEESKSESKIGELNETDQPFVTDRTLTVAHLSLSPQITPKISIEDNTINRIENSESTNQLQLRPLRRTNKLRFTKSTHDLSLLSAEDCDDISMSAEQTETDTSSINKSDLPSQTPNSRLCSSELCTKQNISSPNASNISGPIFSNSSQSNTLSKEQSSSEKHKEPFLNPFEYQRPEPRRVSRESEQDISVKSVTELVLPELCERDASSQPSGFDGSLLGGITDHYVPDLILQGTIEKPCAWESDLRRDLDVTSYLNKQSDSPPVQAVAIIGDTNTWEVRVVGRECGTSGMSSLVGAMLDPLPAMCKAKVPAHQCLLFLESKLREFCVLSKTLADMLMTTDFCDIATLTKSLNIDVNDVPLLLAVATTHTPQVATRYGISYR